MSDVRRASIRGRRQITLPTDLCRELGIGIGDSLELEVVDGYLRVTPLRTRALDALGAIRKAFTESNVTEEELVQELRKSRKALTRERYGIG